MARNEAPKTLLDSDVVRHFIAGGQILLLSSIFPKRFVMLDKVKAELCRSKKLEPLVNSFLTMCKIKVLTFPNKRDIIMEYARLVKTFGEGESACLAVARFESKYVASSNIRGIKKYCEDNKITYLTTMDILLQAYRDEKLSEADCDYFIYNVLKSGSKLPCDTIAKYIESKEKVTGK